MVICNYFTRVLVPFYPYCYETFLTFGFFRFYLSAMLSLPPKTHPTPHTATLLEHRPVSPLVLLPAAIVVVGGGGAGNKIFLSLLQNSSD
jgi:hypothetical protein